MIGTRRKGIDMSYTKYPKEMKEAVVSRIMSGQVHCCIGNIKSVGNRVFRVLQTEEHTLQVKAHFIRC